MKKVDEYVLYTEYYIKLTKLPKKESITAEFKSTFNEETIETLVAFSNAKGGTVYVGVSDSGKTQGVTIGKETIPNWINEIKLKTTPQIIADADVITLDKKIIVALFVPEYPIKPVSIRGRYYKRTGNSNHLLSIDEIANEHLKTINSSWDMYPDALNSLDDISIEKVNKSMELMRKNGITINETAIPFLTKYNLLRDNKLTNAAYLLFKNNESIITTIELGRFQDPVTIKDSARTKSDILTQVDEVINYVKKHINLEVIITGNARNTQKWQYPMEAIREIVLNMIIHREYRSSSDSIVKIFNDKIEFYNPGRLPDTITIKDLLSNNYKSTPRNKKVADFFKDMGLIEKYGSGIQRIIGYFKEEKRPLPEFKNISDGFQVTVFSAYNENNTETVEKTVEKSVEKTVEKILKIIEINPQITQNEIAEMTGLTRRGVEWNLSKLKAKGLIKREGADKGGYWKVTNELW